MGGSRPAEVHPAAQSVVLLTDDRMAGHDAPGHPERPARLAAAAEGVVDGAASGLAQVDRPDVDAPDDETLLRVHPGWYLAALDGAAGRGGGWIDADTFVGPGSMIAARLAAGASVQAGLTVARGEAEIAFAVVRPPGHHASSERAAGFCLLNNVAIAAEAIRAADLGERLAIVDWDVHHGDGTQAIYDADPATCYASTHQWPLFPGTGTAGGRGSGPAIGTKHNVPLARGSGDDSFTAAWVEHLLPLVEEFAPDAILVSAGYDAHRDDPLASLEVTEAGYEAVAVALGAAATRLGLRGVALSLEGGYDLVALRGSAAATVRGLLRGLAPRPAAGQ